MRVFMTSTAFIDSGGCVQSETNDGPIMTDSTGYIPAARYISQMLEAGVLLERQRARASESEYEYKEDMDIDDITLDPTRLKSFDVVDAQAITEQLESKVKKARKKASDPVSDVSEPPKDAEPAEAATE